MIPQFELDRALARWKARRSGQDSLPTPAPVPVAEGGYTDVPDEDLGSESSSGVIPIGDGEYEEDVR